mgnify:CR=1 FL=1
MFIRSLKINRSMFILSATIGFALSILSEFLIASNTSINRPIEIWLYSQDFFTVISVLSNANLGFIVLFFDKELFVLLYSVCLEKRKYN